MDIYIYIYIFILLFVFIPKNKYIFFITYSVLFLIGAFRSLDVGTDTSNYYDIYKIINNDSNGVEYILGFIEPGWVFLNYVCGLLFDDYRAVIFIGMFLALTPLFIRIWESSTKPFLVIFYYISLYFYCNTFNVTRQMIAISVIYFSFYYLENNKKKKFILGVLCAMLFHYTAIISLSFIWIIKKIRVSILNMCSILVITYLLGLYVIPKLIPLIPIVGHYSAYIIDAEGSGSLTRILLNVFFVFILAISNTEKNRLYIPLFFVGIVMYNLFAFSSSVGRLALYFTSTQLFLFPNIESKYKLNNYVLKISILIYATTYYFLMLNANSGEIVPYRIWE